MEICKNVIAYWAILTCIISGAIAQNNVDDSIWSLGKCLEYADSANLDIKININGLEADKLRITQARMARLPDISATASENLYFSNQVTNSSFSTGISSGLTLYNGNRINANISKYKQIYNQDLSDFEYQKLSLRGNIITLYINVLYCKENLSVFQEQFELSKQQAKQADEKFKLGMITKLDFLQLETELSQAENNVLKASNQFTKARLALMQILDIPYNSNFDVGDLQSSVYITLFSELPVDSITAIAIGYRPELESAITELQIRSTELNLDRAACFPSLTLGASGSYSGGGQNLNDGIGTAIGFNLNIPIFNRTENKTAIKISKINISDAEISIEQQKRSIEKNVIEMKLEIDNQNSELLMYIKNEESTQEAYKLASAMFSNGQLNSLELLSRKNDYTQAQNNTLQARYGLLSAQISLALYCGKFNVN